MKSQKNTISPQTQQEALAVAKATQKPNQTKEQTKLVAQGIEKGITLYKKQQKEKQREADKLRKKQASKPFESKIEDTRIAPQPATRSNSALPWLLLAASWIGFISYLLLSTH
ncbi:DUF2956 domain-containing protein [Vibrio rumoiensis]|uniref:DUF2956 domain-containing protein n=1 Tax=Vibrio rumoiensis 1S-45 TaxID=1188252 RepID=A0A1E5E159_9VIBR|nr:DUF2956 domain-containing protein [Vibrio rumoiensis]OEF23988.1 hypothetical protein A1QC_02225 [Vibrio rumoiensis 1S-45]